MLGKNKDVVKQLDANSQGLILLDRHLARIIYQKGKDHPFFACKFATHVEKCHNSGMWPKGRSMLAMIAQRFRVEKEREKSAKYYQ